MKKTDVLQVVSQIEPVTKAAQLRGAMAEIERKLAIGVKLAQIHEALIDAGFELTLPTLKTYLYRYRKKQAQTGGKPLLAEDRRTVPVPNGEVENKTAEQPISMQQLDRLMKPDPVRQAEEFAHYERLAKQQRRTRTS